LFFRSALGYELDRAVTNRKHNKYVLTKGPWVASTINPSVDVRLTWHC
jgi:hypothetical protein